MRVGRCMNACNVMHMYVMYALYVVHICHVCNANMFAFLHARMHSCIYVCASMHIACMHGMCACMCVLHRGACKFFLCMYACMFACMYMYMYVCDVM